MSATTALGLVALAIAVGITAPQVWVTVVRGRVDGLSVASVVNTTGSSAAWCYYAALQADVWLLVTSVLYTVGFAAVAVVAVWRRAGGAAWKTTGLWYAALASGVAATAAGWWPGAVGAVMAAGGLTWALPQAWRVWRTPGAARGVSATSWGVAWVDAVVWAAYGAIAGLAALVVWAAGILVGAGAVLAGLYVHRVRRTTATPQETQKLAGAAGG